MVSDQEDLHQWRLLMQSILKKRHLTQLIIPFYLKNWKDTVLKDWLRTG